MRSDTLASAGDIPMTGTNIVKAGKRYASSSEDVYFRRLLAGGLLKLRCPGYPLFKDAQTSRL
jgi:hypothetical protein